MSSGTCSGSGSWPRIVAPPQFTAVLATMRTNDIQYIIISIVYRFFLYIPLALRSIFFLLVQALTSLFTDSSLPLVNSAKLPQSSYNIFKRLSIFSLILLSQLLLLPFLPHCLYLSVSPETLHPFSFGRHKYFPYLLFCIPNWSP